MATVRLVGPDDWETFREIRLRSLQDAPDAFSSTWEREAGFDESEWRRRTGVPIYLVEDPHPVAMGGTVRFEGATHVWGMWTDPAHRGRGHARRILDALLEHEAEAELDVNVDNLAARTAYERYGFVGTGELDPLRSGSEQRVERMVLRRG